MRTGGGGTERTRQPRQMSSRPELLLEYLSKLIVYMHRMNHCTKHYLYMLSTSMFIDHATDLMIDGSYMYFSFSINNLQTEAVSHTQYACRLRPSY